jgi:hypothetical protein
MKNTTPEDLFRMSPRMLPETTVPKMKAIKRALNRGFIIIK